jgi:hypothetical protein
MGNHARLRRGAMQIFAVRPRSFSALLSLHVSDISARGYIANGIALGRQILKA